ncbi:lecithin retinol acyltransferase family protein [Clostridium beijerinckii]|uniref:lecithin retinol acyltransferase family protein n=1 Tax=Clostridium beijerinckii TaxID=1520 RepID=UPI0022E456BB|nr:lecithin retinol acyltransferase family protein [Clostridium beijerinckii]
MDIIRDPIIFDIPDEEQEIWVKRKPSKGNHIKVNRGLYTHHGVYISNDEVIHFTGNEEDSVLDWSKPEVIQTDLSYFLKDGELEVKEYTDDELQDLYPVEHIVSYARACLGDKGYNLVFNNCEHFANVCTLGRFRSRQVEKVFDVIIGRRRKKMGLLGTIGGKIGGFFKGLFGGGSSGGSRSTSNTNTTYEPDKVRIAEIESETKIRLANMEKERIQLSTDAQLEIMEQEYRFKIGLEEAKALGFNNIANTIVGMQEKLNEVAQKRIEIIEKGSLQVVREIEDFYLELKGKITEDNQIYSEEKLPKLLEILEKYDENSPSYKLYFKRVEADMDAQLRSFNRQIDGIAERQSKIIDSFLNSKEKMIDQTAMITNCLIDKMFSKDVDSLQLETTNNIGKLGGSSNNRLLGDGK